MLPIMNAAAAAAAAAALLFRYRIATTANVFAPDGPFLHGRHYFPLRVARQSNHNARRTFYNFRF